MDVAEEVGCGSWETGDVVWLFEGVEEEEVGVRFDQAEEVGGGTGSRAESGRRWGFLILIK